MGANRRTSSSSSSSLLWSVPTRSPATLACLALPTGVLDLYALPSGRRVPATGLRVDVLTHGRATAVAVRPGPGPVAVAVGTTRGVVLLDEFVVANFDDGSNVSAIVYGMHVVVAVSSTNHVLLICPKTKAVLKRIKARDVHKMAVKCVDIVEHTQQDVENGTTTSHIGIVLASQIVTVCTVDLNQITKNKNKINNNDHDHEQIVHVKIGTHPSPVTAIAALNSTLVATACASDPYISFWPFSLSYPSLSSSPSSTHNPSTSHPTNTNATTTKRRRATPPTSKATTPTGTSLVTLVAPVPGISRMSLDDHTSTFCVILRNGDIAIWRNLDSILKDQHRKKATHVPSFHVKNASAFVTAFPKRSKLCVLYGSVPMKPQAHTFSLEEEEEEEDSIENSQTTTTTKVLEMPKVQKNLLVDYGQQKGTGPHRESRLHHNQSNKHAQLQVDASAAVPVGEEKTKKRKQNGKLTGEKEGENNRDDDDDDDGDDDDDDDKDEDEDDDDDGGDNEEEQEKGDGETEENDEQEKDEPTLQDKLSALGISGKSKPNSNANSETLRHYNQHGVPHNAPANMSSRAAVLLQALRSGDSHLLDTCLKNGTTTIIETTLRRVPVNTACSVLLDALVNRVRARPAQAQLYCNWIRSILMMHAGALAMMKSTEHKALHALLIEIRNRTENMDDLCRLRGRLQLVVAQAKRAKVSVVQDQPRMEYVENVGGEEEEEEEEEEDDDDIDNDSVGEEEEEEREDEEEEEDEDEEEESDVEMRDEGRKSGNGTMSKDKKKAMNGVLSGMDVSDDDDDDDDEE